MSQLKTDLSTFNNDWYKPGKSLIFRVMWYTINLCFFRSPFPFYGPKRFLLRLFGAQVGKGLIIKPHVSIKYPWRLVIGDHVWIGEEVWIDNLAKVTLKVIPVFHKAPYYYAEITIIKKPPSTLLLVRSHLRKAPGPVLKQLFALE